MGFETGEEKVSLSLLWFQLVAIMHQNLAWVVTYFSETACESTPLPRKCYLFFSKSPNGTVSRYFITAQ